MFAVIGSPSKTNMNNVYSNSLNWIYRCILHIDARLMFEVPVSRMYAYLQKTVFLAL